MTERRERRRPEFSFEADPFVVERQIRGARLIVGEKNLVIREAEGFLREENEAGQYRPITTQEPGVLMGIKYRNTVLPLISTQEGSCVLIRSVDVDREGNVERVKGPGKVGKELGLEKGDVRRLAIEDPYEKVFRLVQEV